MNNSKKPLWYLLLALILLVAGAAWRNSDEDQFSVKAKWEKAATSQSISNNNLEAGELKELAGLQDLQKVKLYGTYVMEDKFKHLAEVKNLQKQYLLGTKVSTENLASGQKELLKGKTSH